MYSVLTEEGIRNKKEVIVLGELEIEEEELFLKGDDGYRILLSFIEDSNQKEELSEYEGEAVLLYGEIVKNTLKVLGQSAFKTPINKELFGSALKEIEKHPDLFTRDVNV